MPSTKPINVLNAYFEDADANMIFWYTGKDSIIGLPHPDYIYQNDGNHKFARVAFYKFNEVGDDQLQVYMNETINIITAISNTDTTNFKTAQDYTVHFEAVGHAGKVDRSKIRCTVTDNNTISGKASPTVYVTEDSYVDEESKKRFGVGIWVSIENMEYVMTNVSRSLSANAVPIDTEHFPTSYSAEYLYAATREDETNVVNLLSAFQDRIIITATDSLHFIDERLKVLEEKDKEEPHQFLQNYVSYNPEYVPTYAKTEETIQGATVNGPVQDRIIILDPVNKSLKVLRHGIYAIQLKNGFYLLQGETGLELKVYKNTTELPEMRISAYLTSNEGSQENPTKAIKNIYSSNVCVLELTPEDQIILTATWMNIDNVVLENESIISVTALQYNVK